MKLVNENRIEEKEVKLIRFREKGNQKKKKMKKKTKEKVFYGKGIKTIFQKKSFRERERDNNK